jgi:hypothetical protein
MPIIRIKSSVIGFLGKIWGKRKILSMHKPADIDTNAARKAMIGVRNVYYFTRKTKASLRLWRNLACGTA